MTQLDNSNMAETANSLADTTPEEASDYGDFGSDAEEIQILDELLAQVASDHEEALDTSFVVTDIEDYEPPRGILLPKDLIETRLRRSQLETEADLEVLCDFQAQSCSWKPFDAS